MQSSNYCWHYIHKACFNREK